jgi:hypothetical protein
VSDGAYLLWLDSGQDSVPPMGAPVLLEDFIRRLPMMDAVMMAIAFVFFALSIAYAYACDGL